MNLQRIERLKGLLSRIELNAKKPRLAPTTDVMVTRATTATAATAATPAPAIAPQPALVEAIPASLPSAEVISESEFLPPSIPSAAAIGEEPLEEMDLDEVAVELPPLEATSTLEARSDAAASPPPLEDVTAEEVSLEEVDEAFAAPSEPPRTDVKLAKAPFTAEPVLDDLTFSEPPPALDEPKPVSSRRELELPQVADAPLDTASALIEEAEAAPLTPPPESGRQLARPVPSEAPPARAFAPTVEQLGEVVELEEAMGPELELAEPAPVAPKREPEELEFVPSVAVSSLREAMPTLHEEEPPVPSEPSVASAPLVARSEHPVAAAPEVFEDEAPTSVAEAVLAAAVVARPLAVATRPVVDVIAQAKAYAPKSFLELLDASLKLGRR